jgi:hypothetical protein
VKRSAGVTVIAILSLLGSGLIFAMGIFMLAVMAFAPVPGSSQFPVPPILFKVILLSVALVYLLPAVWGIFTGIGLWRLKYWARISMIVFAVLLTMMAGFAVLTSLVVPFPVPPNSGVSPSVMNGIRIVMGVFWLTLLGVGIWWVVFFNRSKVKAQFARTVPPSSDASTVEMARPQNSFPVQDVRAGAERPISITILAWLLLVCVLFLPLCLILRSPAILFTKLLTGRPAIALFLSFAVVQLCIGIGLLRLKPAARMAAILYFAFGALNTAVFYFAPGGHGRALALMDSQLSMFPWMRLLQSQPQFAFDLRPSLMIGAVAGVFFAAIPLYFLITRKLAFEKAAAAGINSRVI